jgi:hypothetical protein
MMMKDKAITTITQNIGSFGFICTASMMSFPIADCKKP